jgi:hypothetical protein
LLYVVIEGYRDLRLVDPTIDELLADGEFADALRLGGSGNGSSELMVRNTESPAITVSDSRA